jgi:D-alanine-D-alanine ligase
MMTVLVFVPYRETARGLESPYYDDDGVKADVASWFAPDATPWTWVRVTFSNISRCIELARGKIVINLCDGDDDESGYPGVSVIRALEAASIPFTGADSIFYQISTSKPVMKRRFQAHGVPTAGWVEIHDLEEDLYRAAEHLGFPMMIKPAAAAASAGIFGNSVVTTLEAAHHAAKRLQGCVHGFQMKPNLIFTERFLPGREFSVLVVADPASETGLISFASCERVFNSSLPPDRCFVTFEDNCGEYDEESPPPDGLDPFSYAPVHDLELDMKLRNISLAAFRALDGTGYGRVDIRLDDEGCPHVLEVNANCGLSNNDWSTAGFILKNSHWTMGDFLRMIMRDAIEWRL